MRHIHFVEFTKYWGRNTGASDGVTDADGLTVSLFSQADSALKKARGRARLGQAAQ